MEYVLWSFKYTKGKLIIDQIDFVKELDKILEKYEINTIKVYILTRFIINFLPYLDENLIYYILILQVKLLVNWNLKERRCLVG